MIDSRFMGMVFNNFQHFLNLLVWFSIIFNIFRIYWYGFFVKIPLLVNILRILYVYTFQKFVRIYWWCLYDLNGTTLYLGNSSYPPPPLPIGSYLSLDNVLAMGLFFNSKICRMDIRYFEASTCPNLNAYGYLGYEPIKNI